jgi:hypothetical protein
MAVHKAMAVHTKPWQYTKPLQAADLQGPTVQSCAYDCTGIAGARTIHRLPAALQLHTARHKCFCLFGQDSSDSNWAGPLSNSAAVCIYAAPLQMELASTPHKPQVSSTAAQQTKLMCNVSMVLSQLHFTALQTFAALGRALHCIAQCSGWSCLLCRSVLQ